jgi:hypothetical protein
MKPEHNPTSIDHSAAPANLSGAGAVIAELARSGTYSSPVNYVKGRPADLGAMISAIADYARRVLAAPSGTVTKGRRLPPADAIATAPAAAAKPQRAKTGRPGNSVISILRARERAAARAHR